MPSTTFPKRRIMVVYQTPAPFVMNDVQIIQKTWDIRRLQYVGKKRMPTLVSHLSKSHLVYCWFALGHATTSVLLSKILRKKSIVVAGGWDVVYLPEIDYGAMKSPRRIGKTRFALGNADKVLAVSESTKERVLDWVDRDVEVVYNGVDTEKFTPKGERENLVLTVAGVSNEVTYRVKGIDVFLKVAERNPDIDFAIVGSHSPEWESRLRNMASRNVNITGGMSERNLIEQYRKARIYAQLSYHESFGVALAEAMSCGCIPVATNRFALPEVVGDAGSLVDYGDVEGTEEAINRNISGKNGERARQRIKSKFDLKAREVRLTKIISDCLEG